MITCLANGILLIDLERRKCVMTDLYEINDVWIFRCSGDGFPAWMSIPSTDDYPSKRATLAPQRYFERDAIIVQEKKYVECNDVAAAYIKLNRSYTS